MNKIIFVVIVIAILVTYFRNYNKNEEEYNPYDNTKIENVLSSVCIALNVQYKKESGKYKIF